MQSELLRGRTLVIRATGGVYALTRGELRIKLEVVWKVRRKLLQ
jgi:hypothetical protein